MKSLLKSFVLKTIDANCLLFIVVYHVRNAASCAYGEENSAVVEHMSLKSPEEETINKNILIKSILKLFLLLVKMKMEKDLTNKINKLRFFLLHNLLTL